MTLWHGRTRLWVAAIVAVLSVTAAAVVLAQDRTTSIKKITGASDAAPGLAWAVDASASGVEGAVFADPRTGSIYPYGAGAIRIDDVLMTLALVTDDDMYSATDARMVGIDAGDGSVLWSTPALDLAACAEQPLDGVLVCHQPTYGETPGFVTFDPHTGRTRNYPTDLDLFAVTTAHDSLYVATGDLEGGDVALHRGTLEDPSADWTVPLDVAGGWEDQYADKLTVGDGLGTFDIGGEFSTFDAGTGRKVWATDLLDDCVLAVSRTSGDLAVASTFECDDTSSNVTGSTAFRNDGTVLASSKSPFVHYPSPDAPSDVSVPIVLGNSAFDRTTGERLWSDDILGLYRPADEWNDARTLGRLGAVVGYVGLVQRDGRTTALDLNTGAHLWESDMHGSVFGSDGDSALLSNGTELFVIDVTTGETAWTAGWAEMLPDSEGSLDILVDGGDGDYVLQSGSVLARIEPLPNRR